MHGQVGLGQQQDGGNCAVREDRRSLTQDPGTSDACGVLHRGDQRRLVGQDRGIIEPRVQRERTYLADITQHTGSNLRLICSHDW
jgi:hypothetical protein